MHKKACIELEVVAVVKNLQFSSAAIRWEKNLSKGQFAKV
jgi:hypothetical protein